MNLNFKFNKFRTLTTLLAYAQQTLNLFKFSQLTSYSYA